MPKSSKGKSELNRIKSLYGEEFMHLCREMFPTFLEQENLLSNILSISFAGNSRTLGEDIRRNHLEIQFKEFIYSKIGGEGEKINLDFEKSPFEYMDKAGYNLYECKTEEDIQSFKKYYEPLETLCTFRGGRLDTHIVFFAVRKDVDKIRREDFDIPRREDEYSTSVMSIQFNRLGRSSVSIKSRYNQRVSNPDATYGNNLDRIIPRSFSKFYYFFIWKKG